MKVKTGAFQQTRIVSVMMSFLRRTCVRVRAIEYGADRASDGSLRAIFSSPREATSRTNRCIVCNDHADNYVLIPLSYSLADDRIGTPRPDVCPHDPPMSVK